LVQLLQNIAVGVAAAAIIADVTIVTIGDAVSNLLLIIFS